MKDLFNQTPIRKRFKGDLRHPIRVEPSPDLWVELVPSTQHIDSRDKAVWGQWFVQTRDTVQAQRFVRLLQLIEHYEIDAKGKPANAIMFELCMALAVDCLPGFAVEEKKPRGRKNKWQNLRVDLFFEVEEIMSRATALTGQDRASEACRKLARREKWRGYTAENLYQRYLEIKANPRFKLARDVLAVTDAEGVARRDVLRAILDDSAEKYLAQADKKVLRK